VKWIAFPLHPETPQEGWTLEQLFAGQNINIPAVLARLKQAAADVELPLAERTMTYNSRRATELSKWAEDLGRDNAFHDAVFRAYFAEGLNIADATVLKDICRGLGLDPEEADRVLTEGIYGQAVNDDWTYSRKLGITAVPTFLASGRSVVGAQPYNVLEKLVRLASEEGPVSSQRPPTA
jgi:predicted DsbA family dithiol-disulfide isomerase